MPAKVCVVAFKKRLRIEHTLSAKYYIPVEKLVAVGKKDVIIELIIFRWRLAGV